MTRLRPIALALFCLLLTLCVSAVSHAQINSASVSPLSINNGSVTITANVTFSASGGSVVAYVYKDGDFYFSTSLSNTSGNTWTGTFNVGGDYGPGAATHKYTAVIDATDGNGTVYTAQAVGTVTQIPDTTGPIITNATLTPSTSIPVSGGALNVTATVAPPNVPQVTVSNVTATIYKNGVYVASLPLTNNGSGNDYTTINYSGYTAPANLTSGAITYTAIIEANDSDNASSTATATGTPVQQADTLPVIMNATLTPSTIPVMVGDINVSATITDSGANATGVSGVSANIYANGTYVGQASLTNNGSGTSYSSVGYGPYLASANLTTGPITYTAVLYVGDTVGATVTKNVTGSCVQQADTLPVITNAALTPSTIPILGGDINISATVTDSGANVTGVTSVYAYIYVDGTNVGSALLTNNGSGTSYTSVGYSPYTAPANKSAGSITYTAVVYAQDNAGGLTHANASGSCVQQNDNQGPVVTNVKVTPNPLGAAGGTVTVTATVTDTGGNNTGVNIVTVNFTSRTIGGESATLTNTSGNNYSGMVTLPASTATNPNDWYTALTATDNAGNQTVVNVPFTQTAPGSGPLTITNATVTPSTLPATGGTITVSADVTAPAGVSDVVATIFANGVYYTAAGLSNTSGSTWSTQAGLPANTSGTSVKYTAVITGYDNNDGTSNLTASGSCTVANDSTPPVVTNATIAPSTLTGGGGQINVTATVTDTGGSNTGVQSVVADIYANGTYGTYVAQVSLTNNGSGNNYTTVDYNPYVAPGNKSASSITYTAVVIATDNVNNTTTVNASGACVEKNDTTAPVITNATIGPPTLPALGGQLNISATVTDTGGNNTGVSNVEFDVYENSALYGSFSVGDGEVTVSGSTYTVNSAYDPIGVNNTSGPITYTVVVIATDNAGNTATVNATGSCVQQNDDTPPVITSATLTPSTLPVLGGTLVVRATVTDIGGNNTGVQSVQANIFANGVNINAYILSNGGSGNVYTSPITISYNNQPGPITYTAQIVAADNVGNTATANASGTCVQQNDDTPPVITNVTLTPNPLSASGGDITLTATVTDTGGNNTGVKYVNAQFLQNGVPYASYFTLTNTSGNTYVGTLSGATGSPAPANTSGDYIDYSVVVSATDNVNNVSYATAGPDRQPSSASQPAPTLTAITPTSAYANTSVTLTLTGTNFGLRSTVLFGSTTVIPLNVFPTELVAVIPASALATVGTVTVKVVNGGPGGGTSAGKTFTVLAPVASLSLSPTSVTGGASSTGTVTLSADAPVTETITLKSGTTSAATVPASVTIAAGAKTATFTVTTVEVGSVKSVALSAIAGVTKSATLTMNPPAPTNLTINPASVTGGANATGTVTIAENAPTGGESIALTGSNTAAATVPSSVTIAAGAKTATFTVTTHGVGATASVTLTATAGGTSTTAILTVLPPTPKTLTLNPTSLIGGASSTGTVTLSAAPAVNETVALTSGNSAATVPASVTVSAGSTTATFTVTTTTVTATTSAVITATAGGVSKTATLTINPVPPTPKTLTLSPTSVTGGSDSTATITLTADTPTDLTVDLTSNNADAAVPPTATVPAGTDSITFDVVTSSVTTTQTAAITATANGGSASGTLTITPATTGLPTVTSFTPTSGPIGTVITVTGTNLNGVTAVRFHNANATTFSANAAGTQLTVTVPTGAGTGTFTITTPAGSVKTTGTFTVN